MKKAYKISLKMLTIPIKLDIIQKRLDNIQKKLINIQNKLDNISKELNDPKLKCFKNLIINKERQKKLYSFCKFIICLVIYFIGLIIVSAKFSTDFTKLISYIEDNFSRHFDDILTLYPFIGFILVLTYEIYLLIDLDRNEMNPDKAWKFMTGFLVIVCLLIALTYEWRMIDPLVTFITAILLPYYYWAPHFYRVNRWPDNRIKKKNSANHQPSTIIEQKIDLKVYLDNHPTLTFDGTEIPESEMKIIKRILENMDKN